MLAVGAVSLVPRRHPEVAHLVCAWGYPFLPVVFLIVSAVMLANGVIQRPTETGLSVGIILAGIPAYYGWRAWQARRSDART